MDTICFNICPHVQKKMSSILCQRHVLHCVWGSVANSSNSSTLPRLESCALSSYWTGCRLRFVADRGEENVGEGGSRSFKPIHEHESSQFVSQRNLFRSALIARDPARELRHGKQRVYDRFFRDSDFGKSMREHDQDEDVCLKWDELADQDFTYRKQTSPIENRIRIFSVQNWWISLDAMGTTSRWRRSGSFFEKKKKIFRTNPHNLFIGLTIDGKHVWQVEEERKKIVVLCWIFRDNCVFSSSSDSWRILIDPLFPDNVIIQSNYFHHIYHVGCALNLHSIIDSGLIFGGQSSSKRQTVFFCMLILWTGITMILMLPTWMCRVVYTTCMTHGRHQAALVLRKDWYSIRLFPTFCIPKVVRVEIGEDFCEKVFMIFLIEPTRTNPFQTQVVTDRCNCQR